MAALIEKADAADFDASKFTLQTPKGAVIDTSWGFLCYDFASTAAFEAWKQEDKTRWDTDLPEFLQHWVMQIWEQLQAATGHGI